MGGICTCLGFFSDPMFLQVSLNSCPLNLLLVRSYQAEIIISKHLIQRRSFFFFAYFAVKDGRVFQQSCVTSWKLQQFRNKCTNYSAAMAFSIEEKLDSFMTEITNNFTKLNERLDNYEAKLEKNILN